MSYFNKKVTKITKKQEQNSVHFFSDLAQKYTLVNEGAGVNAVFLIIPLRQIYLHQLTNAWV